MNKKGAKESSSLWVTLNIYYVRSIVFSHSNHFLIERDNRVI